MFGRRKKQEEISTDNYSNYPEEYGRESVFTKTTEQRAKEEVRRLKDKANSIYLMVSQGGVYLPVSLTHELKQINEALIRIRHYAFNERVKREEER